jgi:NAD(P)-dependent dehydrogenase (short-subunit alcohol dehydrogenase family)
LNAGILPVDGYSLWGIAKCVLRPLDFLTTTTVMTQSRGLTLQPEVGTVFATNVLGHYLLVSQEVVVNWCLFVKDPFIRHLSLRTSWKIAETAE